MSCRVKGIRSGGTLSCPVSAKAPQRDRNGALPPDIARVSYNRGPRARGVKCSRGFKAARALPPRPTPAETPARRAAVRSAAAGPPLPPLRRRPRRV